MKLFRLATAAAIAAVAAMMPTASHAVKAYPGTIMVTQPDGSTLAVRQMGDEWSKMTVTDEATPYLLLPDADGALCYARLDADGKVVSSGVRATARPGAAEAAMRSSINPEQVKEAYAAFVGPVADAVRSQYASRFALNLNAAPGAPAVKRAGVPNNMLTTNFPSKGKQKAIVILVQYSDLKFNLADPATYFRGLLNTDGFSEYKATGSAHEYFYNASCGQFDCDFDVYGPITLSHVKSYYGGNDAFGQDQAPEEMVLEACNQLDEFVNFADYDRDGDGVVDNIFVFYAGTGEATSGNKSDVWPHSFDIRTGYGKRYYDGVVLGNYACTNEWIAYDGNPRPDGIGTFCHEFSHVMGLPDNYCTDKYLGTTAAFTPGDWTLLDNGPYVDDGRTPPTYTAFERISMGWLEPTYITERGNYELEPLIDSNKCYVIMADMANEFYVLENRQLKGQDVGLPGHGMLIWHIDYLSSAWTGNVVNNTVTHQRIDLIEANNQTKKTSSSLAGRPGNPFPGTRKITEYTAETSPAFLTWSNTDLGLGLTEIAETDGLISFKVAGGYTYIDPVKALPVTDVTSRSVVAHWEKSPKATDYEVTVARTADGATVAGWNNALVGNTDHVTVDGLEPDTEYSYTVRCAGDDFTSELSNAVTFTSGPLTFDYIIPTANPATEIGNDSFTANWEPIDGATGYLLDIYSKTYANITNSVADMTAGADGLPEGWTTNASKTYNTASYSGASAPSMRVSRDQHITTPTFEHPIIGYSFWARASTQSATANVITVSGLIGKEWVTLATINPSYSTAQVWVEDEIPANCFALRFSYSGSASGDLALDDITVVHGEGLVLCPLGNYSTFNVGNVTSHTVTGTTAGTKYFYVVRGTDGTLVSLPSREITVAEGWTGITDVTVSCPEAPVEYFTLQGVRVNAAALAPGIYIRRQGATATKVIIR